MPNLFDQQPLVPPVLRRFQAIKEQQALHVKHNAAVRCSTSDDRLAPSESSGTKLSPKRQPKSTVHGVVDQFGQFHEQKSGIDRLLTSVGNIFRRMSTHEVRTFCVLASGQNVDSGPDEKCLPLQENVSHKKGDRNSDDNVHPGKEELPVVMITQFKETMTKKDIRKCASSQLRDSTQPMSCKGGIPKSGDTASSKSLGRSISNTNGKTIPKSSNGGTPKSRHGTPSKSRDNGTSKSRHRTPSKSRDNGTPKSRHRTQSKSNDRANSRLYERPVSRSPEEVAAAADEHGFRNTRCTPDSDIRQPEVSHGNRKQWTSDADKLDIFCEISENTEVLLSSPECDNITKLPNSRHRKLNFSKIFRIKKNADQKYSLPPYSSLGKEQDHSPSLLRDPEQDDTRLHCSDSKEIIVVQPTPLPCVQQCHSGAIDITHHSSNSLMRLPDRKGCPVKYLTNKIKALSGRGAAANDPDGNMRRPGRRATSRSNMATSPEAARKFPSDTNLTKCEHLAESTDELTQLIWAAF